MTNKQKTVLGITAFVGAGAILIGLGYAYFSDIIDGSGSATAGTLDITGTISFAQNGATVEDGEIDNFNPGDIVTIAADGVTNAGSKSAWVRTLIKFDAISSTDNTNTAGESTGDLASYLYVCPSTATDASLRSAADGAALLALSCELANTEDEFGASEATIIDGTAEDDDWNIKPDVDAPDGIATSLPVAGLPKIYFAHFAGNDAQLGSASFSVLIEALQYRNNTTTPTDTQWQTVVDEPFAI